MGKIKKKGTAGQAKNFITRTQAVRKLQISLPDFRRLCIFKGIYPREPRNKKKASKSSTASTTFYYTKDIQYLLHEPLLNKFRDHKALSKKIARALGRGDVGDAARLEKNGATKISLDHIIKERYPTFVDALRDLDDALSLLFLFASLPSTSAVPPKTISLCQRLCLEFQHYLIISHSLRKSFLSIKGIYYQATIQGQDILWLVPYKFVQRMTGDIDFRIMGTFVEFYTTLLGFVNFRLYTSIGLVYPPKFDAKSDEKGGELGAFTLIGKGVEAPATIENGSHVNGEVNGTNTQLSMTSHETQNRVDALGRLEDLVEQANAEVSEMQAEESNDTIDTFEPTGPGADILPQPQISGSEASALFASCNFFLSRETPRQPLEFILRAFGCKRVGWDAVLGDGAFTHNENDPNITHQVVDRPPVSRLPESMIADDADTTTPVPQTLPAGHRVPGRIYVQPQWVWDCINSGKLLRPDLYAPGAILPPHLSPWIKPTKGAYDPSAPLETQEREGEAEEFAEAEAEAAQIAAEEQDDMEDLIPGVEKAQEFGSNLPGSRIVEVDSDVDSANGMNIAGSDSGEDSDESADDFGGFDDDIAQESPDEAEALRDLHQAELEAEAAGLTFAEAGVPDGTQLRKGILKSGGLKAGKGSGTGDELRRRASRKKKEEEEELQRRMGMMGRKKRKLMEKMMYGKRVGEEEAERLRAKRRRLEKEKGLSGIAGKV